MTFSLTHLLWVVQFACEVVLFFRLKEPELRPFRWLIAYAALTDVIGWAAYAPTSRYFYVYWTLRIVEVNWAVLATCRLAQHVLPHWRTALWAPFVWGIGATIANGLPQTNAQMCIWETFMLLLAAATAWFATGTGAGFKASVLTLAMALTCSLQLACVILWRSWGYSADIWMIAWIAGLALMWRAARSLAPHV